MGSKYLGEMAAAAEAAWSDVERTGLAADAEGQYTQEQGNKAACLAREDAAAVLILQGNQLQHLEAIKLLLWACLGLLAFIAYRIA